ncbi:YdcF family protein [Nocardia acidivorans]|uniref:YdcF family protein n=1 Tax=Nocardia acidivorans TaxID=404580 RepID=UPI0014710F3A|nr:YdcF family protein [Nocardia acidivorans]
MTAALLSIGLFLLALGAFRVVREPRRLSTGFVLLGAVLLLVAGSAAVAADVVAISVTVPQGSCAAALALCCIGIALIANGFTVVRREGRSLTTLSPAVVGAGLVMMGVVIAAIAIAVPVPAALIELAMLVCAAGGYLILHLLAFGGYALLYRTLPARSQADAIVILGCGLDGRSVTPLLAGRLDRAITAYHAASVECAQPVVVTCGGQGGDEGTCEADAMARYLVAHGIPAHAIVRERYSRNTAENIRNCLRQLDIRGIPADRIRMTVVTSSFHVLRTAALTRRAGIDAAVVGSRTAAYFIPAAFLREFVAVLTTHYRRTHLTTAALTVAAATAVVADAALPPL